MLMKEVCCYSWKHFNCWLGMFKQTHTKVPRSHSSNLAMSILGIKSKIWSKWLKDGPFSASFPWFKNDLRELGNVLC